jgi:hypothetical protein
LFAVLVMLVADGNTGALQRLDQALAPRQLAQLRSTAQHHGFGGSPANWPRPAWLPPRGD